MPKGNGNKQQFCPSVRPSVRPSVSHIPIFYANGLTYGVIVSSPHGIAQSF